MNNRRASRSGATCSPPCIWNTVRHRFSNRPTNSATPNDPRLTFFPFTPSEPIPSEYTCEGNDLSPSLGWTHLPGDTTRLPRNVDLDAEFADRDLFPQQGTNDFSDVGYGGPCTPPSGGPHRYFFRLYALDTVLDLGGASRTQVTDTMDGHVLDETDLVDPYER